MLSLRHAKLGIPFELLRDPHACTRGRCAKRRRTSAKPLLVRRHKGDMALLIRSKQIRSDHTLEPATGLIGSHAAMDLADLPCVGYCSRAALGNLYAVHELLAVAPGCHGGL